MFRIRTGAFAALATTLLLAVPASAQLQSEGVIYAYMSLRVGSVQQPVIVPIPAEQVRPDMPLQATIPAAFGLLRYGKPATYGNASVTVSDALLAQERVAVNLDPAADASAFEVISAETVLTFAALGIERVIFPGWNDAGLTAADIEYATFRFQVPMWQALVGGQVHGADIVMPDDSRVPSAEFYQRLADGDPRVHAAILDVLGGSNRVAAYYLLTVIANLGVDGYEAAVAPLVHDSDPAYRAAALNALAPSSSEGAWDAILEMMTGDADPQLRAAAAQALAVAPIEEYRVYEVFYRADSGNPSMELEAIAQMAQIDDPRIAERLRATLADPTPEKRRAAADALHQLGAWGPLQSAMGDASLDPEVRLLAATALANDASGAERLAGLEYRADNTVGDIAVAAVDRIAALTDVEAGGALDGVLAHSDIAVAIHAAGVIAARGDRGSLEALSAVGSDESRPLDLRVAVGDAAYRILGGLDASSVGEVAAGRDAFLKRAAYRALGDLAAAGRAGGEVYDTLRSGLGDTDPGIRGASARALASYGTPEALELIASLQDDPVAEVRADVALAMGEFGDAAFIDITAPTLVTYVESGDPVVVAAALDALASLDQRQLLGVVLDKVRFPDGRVRAAAMRAAAALGDPAEPQPVINAIGAGLRDPEIPNRVLSAQLLGRFANPLAILSLSQVVNGPEPEVRYAAISALGATQHPDAVGTLLALLEDPEREIRLAAVDALRTLNMSSAIMGVEAQIARESDPVSAEALRALAQHLSQNGI